MTETFASQAVLDFYRVLPFNYQQSADVEADRLRGADPVAYYPPLRELLRGGTTLLEVGCGAGWLTNTIAYHYRCNCTAIDFNPVAVARAREVSELLENNAIFEVADLFTYKPARPAQVVVSLGVLHHTENCVEALKRVFEEFVSPGGSAFIGLYHAYGRKPFLDHFSEMKARGANEEAMLEAYANLDRRFRDRTHLMSWFRDQVLHPLETQHTLAEMLPVMESCGMSLVATSINNYGPINDMDGLLVAERDLQRIGGERLARGDYYPGFFTFLARKEKE